jgi:hypothetical protein
VRIISFAWTTKALLNKKKTVTRRLWKKCPLEIGDLVQAYDKNPRVHGKCVAIIQIVDIRFEPLDCVTDEEERLEGGLWGSGKEYLSAWFDAYPDSTYETMVWRIEFKFIRKV